LTIAGAVSNVPNTAAPAGHIDGLASVARFSEPHDVAVDTLGTVYVADTGNNVIRMISSSSGTSQVSTIAGTTVAGFIDGDCSKAQFSSPKGIDVREDSILVNIGGKPSLQRRVVLAIADTGNHRIRRVDIIPSIKSCVVTCTSGLCGNSTISLTSTNFKATPNSGYGDGDGDYARFSSPSGVAFVAGTNIVVADSGNYLIRWVAENGNTSTLAGNIVAGETAPSGI
jgi:hypothetical protein